MAKALHGETITRCGLSHGTSTRLFRNEDGCLSLGMARQMEGFVMSLTKKNMREAFFWSCLALAAGSLNAGRAPAQEPGTAATPAVSPAPAAKAVSPLRATISFTGGTESEMARMKNEIAKLQEEIAQLKAAVGARPAGDAVRTENGLIPRKIEVPVNASSRAGQVFTFRVEPEAANDAPTPAAKPVAPTVYYRLQTAPAVPATPAQVGVAPPAAPVAALPPLAYPQGVVPQAVPLQALPPLPVPPPSPNGMIEQKLNKILETLEKLEKRLEARDAAQTAIYAPANSAPAAAPASAFPAYPTTPAYR